MTLTTVLFCVSHLHLFSNKHVKLLGDTGYYVATNWTYSKFCSYRILISVC